jgi:ribonuclease P protein component
MALYTFRKEERIRRRADFQRISREGARYQTRHFRVSVSPNGLAHGRLGITVTKRIGSAVQRNRIKRLIREFFRLHKRELPGSSDLVISARKGAAGLNFWQVSEELKGLFKEPSLLKIGDAD